LILLIFRAFDRLRLSGRGFANDTIVFSEDVAG